MVCHMGIEAAPLLILFFKKDFLSQVSPVSQWPSRSHVQLLLPCKKCPGWSRLKL